MRRIENRILKRLKSVPLQSLLDPKSIPAIIFPQGLPVLGISCEELDGTGTGTKTFMTGRA